MRTNILVLAVISTMLTPLANAGGATAPGSAEVRTLSERVPAGGTVQVKYLLTQPRPITSGGYAFASYGFSVDGIAFASPLGDTAGAAVVNNGMLNLSVISPSSDFGTNLDYPFITVTMDIPASTPAGSTFPLGIDQATVQSPSGPLTLTDPKPGILTIGGSVSVRGVFPGGGVQPAGTIISVQGRGFQPGTKIATKMKVSPAVYISPTELRFTLKEAVAMDSQPILVSNPDGSQVTFYSYLRGAVASVSPRPVLRATEPVFQMQTHAGATVSGAACGPSEYLALAIQNPNAGPVSVGFTNQTTGAFSSIVLGAGQRIMDDIPALLGAPALGSGETLAISATSAVQILGLCADDGAMKVTPFLPVF